MAAPTPVSSLVHSSTLVTAGVFLLIRFRETLAAILNIRLLLAIGIFTIIMAGISAIYEIDIKKIVALSTLSQLGLIVATLGLGFHRLAFFHLLAHAFFKALLFISVGNIIHLSSDYQDLRKLKVSSEHCSLTLAFRLIANLSLCGTPFLAGFYSKDIILESRLFGGLNFIFIFIFFLATALTVAYSSRFIVLTALIIFKKHAHLFEIDKDTYMRSSIQIL